MAWSTLVGVNPHMYPFVSIRVLKNTYRVKVNNSKAQRNLKMKSESKQIWVCIEMMNVQVLRVEDGKKTCHKNVQNPMPQAIPNITMGKIIPRYTYDWVYRHISHQETIKPYKTQVSQRECSSHLSQTPDPCTWPISVGPLPTWRGRMSLVPQPWRCDVPGPSCSATSPKGDHPKIVGEEALKKGTWWMRCARTKSRLVWLGPYIFIWPEGASIPTYGCVFIHG